MGECNAYIVCLFVDAPKPLSLTLFIIIGVLLVLKIGHGFLMRTPEYKKWQRHKIGVFRKQISQEYDIPIENVRVKVDDEGTIYWDEDN